MRRILRRVYQWEAGLLCRSYRQCQPFLAVATIILLSSVSQAHFACLKVHTFAFEFQQRESLQKFVDLYAGPRASYAPSKRLYNFGFTLVGPLEAPSLIYEFHSHEHRIPLIKTVSPDRHIISKSSFTRLSLPQKDLDVSMPDGSTSQYQVTDVGFNLLRQDEPRLRAAFDKAVTQKEGGEWNGKPFQIEYHPDYFRAARFLTMLHQWASLLVTDVYSNRKGYLSPSDLYSLRNGDLHPESSDNYFVLQKKTDTPMVKQSFQQFLDNTLAIMRLVRGTQSTMMIPDKYDERKSNPYELPVVKRYIGSEVGHRLKEALYDVSGVSRKSLGEISRYVRTSDFPEPLMDSLIKNVFEAAIQPEGKIDLLFISVDRATKKLFSRYRFQELMPLTDPSKASKDSTEFLLYIDTSSPEFHQTLYELKQKAATVHEGPFYSSTPISPQNKYPAPPNWSKGSRWEVQDIIEKRISRLNMEYRERYDRDFSALMQAIVGDVILDRKILIVSEQKDAIYQTLAGIIDPSFVTVVRLSELENNNDLNFDQIVFSAVEYPQVMNNGLMAVARKLVPKAKGRARFNFVLPNTDLRDGFFYYNVAVPMRSIPGTDNLFIGGLSPNPAPFF